MDNKALARTPAFWIATWFGAGLMKPAPGTWGSAAAIPFGLIIFLAGGVPALILATLLVAGIGLWAAGQIERLTGAHDSKMIVIDEVAGQWLSLLPALWIYGMEPLPVLAGFALFRLFDILKPWPVSWADQKIGGGLGVMLDDILAGAYAALCVIGFHYAGPG
jgi:phosphatidylglycerophosphatase A